MMLQAQPSDDELAELRGAVLQQVDVNRDGKIELGEFARYQHDTIRYVRSTATRREAKLQSLIFQSCNFQSCKFSYPICALCAWYFVYIV